MDTLLASGPAQSGTRTAASWNPPVFFEGVLAGISSLSRRPMGMVEESRVNPTQYLHTDTIKQRSEHAGLCDRKGIDVLRKLRCSLSPRVAKDLVAGFAERKEVG
jgi:hypothetical protein